jgi:hypothetical protein
MRVTLLSCLMLTVSATTAAAQTYAGPWQPRPSVGGAFGVFASSEHSNTGKLLLSGTFELPLTDKGRIRIEAGSGSFPVVFGAGLPSTAGTARLSRLTAGGAALIHPGAPMSPYVGASLGVYRMTTTKGPTSVTATGGHLYGGAEIMASDSVSVDVEVGVHLLELNALKQMLFGEALLRFKVGL